MNTREILEVLPHRYPFMLIDKVISLHHSPDPKNRAGSKIVDRIPFEHRPEANVAMVGHDTKA